MPAGSDDLYGGPKVVSDGEKLPDQNLPLVCRILVRHRVRRPQVWFLLSSRSWKCEKLYC